MTLEEKLKLWVEITGVDPNENITKWVISTNRLSDYDVQKMNNNIKTVMENSNEIMTEIVLRNFFIEFLKDRRINLYDIVMDDGTHESMISKCKTLLNNLTISEEENDLKKTIKTALDFYNKDIVLEDIDMYEVVSLYVSAKKNIEKLKTVQFKKGKKSKNAPKLLKEIYLFNSIDEVINGINSFTENAVMLCYIHDKEESSASYFCYVIKNMDNIFLLGDMPEYAHPYQKFLSRCPSRDMAERINASFFPYSLAGVNLSCRYSVDDEHSKDENFKSLGAFSSMTLEELIWNIYMLQFIKEKFFENEYECEEISYTGNMLNTPLIEKTETALAIYNGFPMLNIPVIESIEETDDLQYGTDAYPHEKLGLFKNVIDRFKDQVDIKECQIFDSMDTTKLIVDKDSFGRDITTDLLNVNTNSFGTIKEINRRNKWALRFNYATKINQLAEKEYKEKSGEIRKWYEQKVLENLPTIIEKAIKDEYKGKARVTHTFCSIRYQTPKDGENTVSLVKKEMANNVDGMYFYPKNRYKNISELECLLSGAKGTICLTISPYDIEDICNILDISIDEVPVQIKDWCATQKLLHGNHLLGDYDPLDWVIRDYWYHMNFGIALIFSKKAYNEKRKELGLPSDKFWN